MEEFTTVEEKFNMSGFYENVTKPAVRLVFPDSTDREIGRMIQVVMEPTILVFYSLANILFFNVMQRGTLKGVSISFYMWILALADIGD